MRLIAQPRTLGAIAPLVLGLVGTARAETGEDASGSAPAVLMERPYLAWARPRPKGAVAAAGHDEQLGRWNFGGTGDPDFPSNRPGFHPGTRVKVDTTVIAGHLPKHARLDRRTGKHERVLSETSLLARARRSGYWPFRLCYEDRVRAVEATPSGRRPKLDGEAVLRFTVSGSGAVTHPTLARSKLDPSLTGCLVEATRKLDLLPPARAVRVELVLQLWSGDVKLPAVAAAPETEPKFDPSAVERAAQPLQATVASCYAAGLANDSGLWGRVEVQVELDAAGAVKSARERESRFPSRETAECVVRAVREQVFDRPTSSPVVFLLAFRLGEPPAAQPSAVSTR